jgi:TolB protein
MTHRIKTVGWMTIRWWVSSTLLLLLWQIPGFAAYDYVDISNPSLRKIPMAIPYFRVEPYHAEISRNASDICSDTLNFTGYFRMVDRSTFPVNPQETDITGGTLNFESWMSTGAELLITCGTQISGNALEMEFRLFDTFKGKLLIGKRYKGSIADEEEMVRRFCSEVIFLSYGQQGLLQQCACFYIHGIGEQGSLALRF